MTKDITPKFRPTGKFGIKPAPVVITDIKQENSNTKTFTFDESFENAKSGQFLMAWLPLIKESPFCIADINPLKLTICEVGEMSAAIHSLEVGDRLWIRGPFGTSFSIEESNKKPVLVGGGYGAAPLAFLAKEMKKQGISPKVCLGGRTEEAIIGRDMFENEGIEAVCTTNDGSYGEEGLVTKPVERMLENKEVDIIYAVGPNPMLDALYDLAQKYKVPVQLSYEAVMGCGMGNCGSCEKHGKLLCVEGPVLRF